MTCQLSTAERCRLRLAPARIPPPPGSIPWDGLEPLGHEGTWPEVRRWPQNAAFRGVGGCRVMGMKGQREARDTLGGQTASGGASRYRAPSREGLAPQILHRSLCRITGSPHPTGRAVGAMGEGADLVLARRGRCRGWIHPQITPKVLGGAGGAGAGETPGILPAGAGGWYPSGDS